mgnify:CR=1 FL=1
MNQTPPAGGPLSRFMRFTTQKEPVLSAAVVAAFLVMLAFGSPVDDAT